jgi:hypothetical protein
VLWNDGMGGGNNLEHTLMFNLVRETTDHGAAPVSLLRFPACSCASYSSRCITIVLERRDAFYFCFSTVAGRLHDFSFCDAILYYECIHAGPFNSWDRTPYVTDDPTEPR